MDLKISSCDEVKRQCMLDADVAHPSVILIELQNTWNANVTVTEASSRVQSSGGRKDFRSRLHRLHAIFELVRSNLIAISRFDLRTCTSLLSCTASSCQTKAIPRSSTVLRK